MTKIISFKNARPVRRRIRVLSEKELFLIDALLQESLRTKELQIQSRQVRAIDLRGEMGGVRFVHNDSGRRLYDSPLIVADYRDSDEETVSIALNLDQFGDLFELDIWKRSTAPLVRYPEPALITIRDRVGQRRAQLQPTLSIWPDVSMGHRKG